MAKQMSVSAEIRAEQKKALKKMSRKEKLSYFWEYYKFHTLGVIVAAGILFSILWDMTHAKDTVFYAYMLNSYGLDSTALSLDFASFANLDPEQYECYINLSSLDLNAFAEMDIALVQAIMATVQAGDLDVIASSSDVFSYYTRGDFFMDLNTLFTEEELAPYRNHLYYMDAAVVTDPQEAAEKEAAMSAEEKAADLESHRHPERMKTPVPVGVFLTDSAFVKATGCFPTDLQPIFGVIISSKRPENAKAFLNYLWTAKGPAPNASQP